MRLNYDQADREAGFRASLVNVRENAESIALAHGEPRLETRLRRHVDAITANLKRIIAVNRNLSFFTTGYNYLIQLIPALIVAPLFIRGQAEFGVIPQSSMAFAHVLGAFSLIVNQFPMLSSYAAIVARLSALVDARRRPRRARPPASCVVEDESRLAFERLTLLTPHDGRAARARAVGGAEGRLAAARQGTPRCNGRAPARGRRACGRSATGASLRPAGDGVLVLTDHPYLPAARSASSWGTARWACRCG